MQNHMHRVEPLSTFPGFGYQFLQQNFGGEKSGKIFFYPTWSSYICTTMKTIEVTIQEIRMATRPNVYKSKKAYTRKIKHKKVQ